MGGHFYKTLNRKKQKLMIIVKIMNDQKTAAAKVKSLGGLLFVLFCILFEKRKKKMMINHIPEELTRNAYLCISSFSCVSLFTNTWKENYICINCTLLTFHLYYNNILQHTIQLRSNQAKAMANNNSGLCGSRCNVMWFSFSHSFALLL